MSKLEAIDLLSALRLGPKVRLAVVGAGGKTTALFQLAREYLRPSRQNAAPMVLVTATTHLALGQVGLADQHIVLQTLEEAMLVESKLSRGVNLVTGMTMENERLMGVTPEVLECLRSIADKYQVPLLIEADGSRRKPLKAPGEYEPVIPAFVDTVVVVAGVSALGKPISSEWVHRHEIFAALSGLKVGDDITSEGVKRVLKHPAGGLKNIPACARRLLLLNQADTIELQSLAARIAMDCVPDFDAVVIASLNWAGNEDTLQGMQKEFWNQKIWAVHEPIGGVILAAGASRRLGRPKPLLPWHGRPLIWHIANVALRSGLDPVVVVGGEYVTQIREALVGLDVQVVYNPHWEKGQSTSIQAGLGALSDQVGGAIFFLADQPLIPETLVRRLIEIHSATLAPLVAPLIDGKRANPVLFDRVTFGDLVNLQGDVGGRELFGRYPVEWVPWFDASITLDIDTAEDYQKLLAMDVSTEVNNAYSHKE